MKDHIFNSHLGALRTVRFRAAVFAFAQNKRKEYATMENKKIDTLYTLLERAEKENDAEAVAALRWAIFELER